MFFYRAYPPQMPSPTITTAMYRANARQMSRLGMGFMVALLFSLCCVSCVPFALNEENVALERGAETVRIVTHEPIGMNYLGEVVARGNVFNQPVWQIAPEYLTKNAVNNLKNKAYLAGGTVVQIVATHTYPVSEANVIPDLTYVGAVYR